MERPKPTDPNLRNPEAPREIEVKVKINSASAFVEALSARGCELSEPVTQIDTIYALKGSNFPNTQQGEPVVRIREQGNKKIFTLKKKYKDELDCIERETEVTDPEQMKLAIQDLGFEEALRISKTRRRAKIGKVELCLDEVEGLGTFVEAERITDEGTDAARSQMVGLLTELGVDMNQRVTKGYDSLILQKKQN